MKKTIFISHFFPPFADLESRMAWNLTRYLPENGWNVTVVSSRFVFNFPRFDDFTLPPGMKLVQCGMKKEGIFLRALYSKQIVPDPQIGWLPFGYRAAKRILQSNGAAAIVSRANPITSHLIAWILKLRNPTIPWVALFGDPWTQNPYIQFEFGFMRRFFEGIEAKIFSSVDAVVVTNDEARSLFLRRYNGAKIFVIPNSWNEEDQQLASSVMKERPHKKNKAMTLVHAGNLYGLRSPEPLLRALKQLRDSYPEKRIEAVFCGSLGKFSGLISEFGLEDIVKVLGTMSRVDAFRELSKGDAPVLIDAPIEGSMFLPVKFAEYLMFKKPILAITPHGATESAVRRTNSGFIASPSDLNEIKEVLLSMYALWERGNLSVVQNEDEVNAFGAKECSHLLAEILAEVTVNA